MRVIESHIDAPPERVWAVLTDFPAFADWNPFVTSISGAAAPGARLEVRLCPPVGMAMTVKPKVTAAAAGRHFAWHGRLGLPRIFDGAHEFIIDAEASGGVTFVQKETFRGLLVPFLGRVLEHAHEGFELMNTALKERAEGDASLHAPPTPEVARSSSPSPRR